MGGRRWGRAASMTSRQLAHGPLRGGDRGFSPSRFGSTAWVLASVISRDRATARRGADTPNRSSVSETPLDARVGDAETVPLGITLRGTARLGAHHGEIAT